MFMVLLFKLAVFPFGIFYILGGRKGSVVVLVSCLFIAVAFGQQLNVEIGKVSGPERLSIGLTTVFAILSAVVIVVISTKKHLEDNFDGLPWATSNHPDLCTDSLSATRRPPDQEQPPSESYRINLSTMATDIPKIPCPFTGLEPNIVCPCCKAKIHESAFHFHEKLVTFIVGETVLKWADATAAVNNIKEPFQGRIELDEALDFRGNVLFGCVGNACIGCATWQRSFNLLPRLGLTLTSFSMALAFAPWAISNTLDKLGTSGYAFLVLLDAYAIFLAVASLVIQLHAVSTAIAFMTRYHGGRIEFPAPCFEPKAGWQRRVVRFFGDCKWRDIAR